MNEYIKNRVIHRILFFAKFIIEKDNVWTFDALDRLGSEAKGYIEGAYDTDILTFEESRILEFYIDDVLFNTSELAIIHIEAAREYREKIIIKYLCNEYVIGHSLCPRFRAKKCQCKTQ